jgi:hypothetical protein
LCIDLAPTSASADGNVWAQGGSPIFAANILFGFVGIGSAGSVGAQQIESSLTSFASVVALPLGGPNCGNGSNPLTNTVSNGYNFSDDTTCGFAGTGDRQNAGDPQIGALANNGGPTQTRLPADTSPLVDGVPLAQCQADGAAGVTTDQRGITRPQGAGCEIGAVEVVPPVPEPVPEPAVEIAPRLAG